MIILMSDEAAFLRTCLREQLNRAQERLAACKDVKERGLIRKEVNDLLKALSFI